MNNLKQSGEFAIAPAPLAAIRRDFDATRASEAQCAQEISRVHRESGVTIDPHSAIGVIAARAALARDPATPVVALATAHPAKFPDAVESATGERPQLPAHLRAIMNRTERMSILPNDVGAVARYVRAHARTKA
jgi:threonine synthase